MHIAVVGSGYVGLVAGACFADLGHDVILVDNDQAKVAALKAGEVPIHEKFLPELLKRHRGKNLTFSDDLNAAVKTSKAIFIAVGTPPTEQGEADLSYVESVARSVAGAIKNYKVLVEKSTVPVYTSDWVRKIMLRNAAPPDSFDVASNPEFLREGTAVTDFLYPDRIVVGADSDRCAAVLREVYAPMTDGSYYRRKDAIPGPDRAQIPPPLIITSAKSAELIKHASNAFLAMKISFINAVASICESVGANVQQVCQGIGTDSRIGPRFLNPGIGYGGSCFPKDTLALMKTAQDNAAPLRIVETVVAVNDARKRGMVRKVASALGGNLRGKTIAVLGLTFKPNTDDMREAPSLAIVTALQDAGATVRAYDPAGMEQAKKVLENVEYSDGPYACAEGAHALVIVTEWEQFRALDLDRLKREMASPVIVDLRNVYRPDEMARHDFAYESIGRGRRV